MLESDWKKFVKVKKSSLDLFCQKVNSELAERLSNNEKSAHDIYLDVYQFINKKDKLLANTFDGHSRSKACLQLLQMRNQNLVSQEQLDEFSDEFVKQTNPDYFK